MKYLLYTEDRGRNYFFLILLFMLVGFTSCDEVSFFERESSPVLEFKNLNEAEMGIYAPYQEFVQGSTHSAFWMGGFYHLGMSDIIREISENPYRELYMRTFNNNTDGVDNLFAPSYKIISNCNYLIETLESDPFGDISDFDRVNNQDRLLGEAYFLRGYTYLQLASLLCPAYNTGGSNDSKILPLRINFASTLDLALDNQPVETSVIYGQIVDDLTKAVQLLPEKYASGMHPSYKLGRATKRTARAVLAKVNMLMGKYSEALTELNGVLDDSEVPATLLADPKDCFLNNSTDGWDASEMIWYGNFADPTVAVNNQYRHENDFNWYTNYTFPTTNSYAEWWCWSLDKETLKRVGIINDDETETDDWKADKRNDLFKRFDGYVFNENPVKGMSTLSGSGFGPFVGEKDAVYIANKFFLTPDSANYTDPQQNIPMIRSAELYLMRAGIKAMQGSGGQANDLNIVRSRSWDESIGGVYVPLTDADVSWEVVDQEWVKELAFESDRIMWLQLFHKPIGGGPRGVAAINAPYEGFYWPMPDSELIYRQDN